MKTLRLLALTLLIVAHGVAQDQLAHNTSSGTNEAMSDAEGGAAITAIVPKPLPESPASQRVVDKKFVIVMGLLGGTEAMRFTSRKLIVDNEFAAGAPWVTRVPENSHLVAKYAGIFAAETFVAFELKKRHDWLPGDRVIRKFWWAYPAAMGVLNFKNGWANVHTTGPGGCTSIECATQMP